jgi:hypothetical protein
MTRDPTRYDEFCRDKIAALERYVDRHPERENERREATAGIYCWAAESLLELEGASERCTALLGAAVALAPAYDRIEHLTQRIAASPRGAAEERTEASPAHG